MTHPLLELQGLDTTLDQLAHRRATLPARAEREAVLAERAALDAAIAERQAHRDDLARREQRLEDEASSVEAKVAEHRETMYATTSPKELVAMQHEVESLEARQRQLEDEAIELMEQIEPVDAELASGAQRQADLDARLAAADEAIATGEQEVDAEVDAVRGTRGSVASGLDDELVATYDRLRGQLGGVAVAHFDGTRCDGCHLTLSAVEADHLRHAPADELVRCPECERLLVR